MYPSILQFIRSTRVTNLHVLGYLIEWSWYKVTHYSCGKWRFMDIAL